MAARTIWVWWSPEVGAMTALDLKRLALVEIQRGRESSTECTWSLDVVSVCPTNSQKETARQICRNGIIVYIVLWASLAWALFWTNSLRQTGPWSLKRIALVVAQNELAEQYFNFRSKCSIPCNCQRTPSTPRMGQYFEGAVHKKYPYRNDSGHEKITAHTDTIDAFGNRVMMPFTYCKAWQWRLVRNKNVAHVTAKTLKMRIQSYSYIWVNYSDLTVTQAWNHG